MLRNKAQQELDMFAPDEVFPRAIPLSELMGAVRGVIEMSMHQPVWVHAEISHITNHRGSGHVYFDLVELNENGREVAKTRATLWKSKAKKVLSKFKKITGSDLSSGIKVLFRVRPKFHEQYGFSVDVDDVDPAYTLGGMEVKLVEIREALKLEGIQNLNRDMTSPTEFCQVAVISPEGAAGLGDFKREADIIESLGLCHFSYYGAQFQGVNASLSVGEAFRKALSESEKKDFDAIVIIRGGGAKTDLDWLNDINLARGICLSRLPVITGIGHERDDTILDEVACLRFDTPSKVIAHISSSIISNAESAINSAVSIVRHSKMVAKMAESELNNKLESINRLALDAINISEERVEALMSNIIGLGPKATLKRGYAIVRSDSKAIASKGVAKRHDEMNIEFHDGSMTVIRKRS